VSLHDIYKQYHDQVHFLSIYIKEAHPVDGWWMGKGITGLMLKIYCPKAATDLYEAKTIEERRAVAGRCETTLKYGVKTYVDEMDNAVNRVYAAWPTRLYLIGLDGRVVYAGALGPWGFKPKEFRKAIEQYLAEKANRNLSKASYQAAS
jgi:hypothetical protein